MMSPGVTLSPAGPCGRTPAIHRVVAPVKGRQLADLPAVSVSVDIEPARVYKESRARFGRPAQTRTLRKIPEQLNCVAGMTFVLAGRSYGAFVR